MSTDILKILFLSTLVAVSASAYSAPTHINPITYQFEIEGNATSLTAYPAIEINGSDGNLNIVLGTTIDASDLQSNIESNFNRSWKSESCGDRISTSNVQVYPYENSIRLGLTVTFERWYCTSAHLPYKWNMFDWRKQSAKNKAFQQSLDLSIEFKPILIENELRFESEVLNAIPGGIAGDIVKALNLYGLIADTIENRLNFEIQNFTFDLVPDDFNLFGVRVDMVRFKDLGDRRLGIVIDAKADITQENFVRLLIEQIKLSNSDPSGTITLPNQ